MSFKIQSPGLGTKDQTNAISRVQWDHHTRWSVRKAYFVIQAFLGHLGAFVQRGHTSSKCPLLPVPAQIFPPSFFLPSRPWPCSPNLLRNPLPPVQSQAFNFITIKSNFSFLSLFPGHNRLIFDSDSLIIVLLSRFVSSANMVQLPGLHMTHGQKC